MRAPCPYCEHSLKLKSVKPGRYSPKCPKCGRAFALMVAEKDGKIRFGVKALKEKAPAAAEPAADPAVQRTEADPKLQASAEAAPNMEETAFVETPSEAPPTDDTQQVPQKKKSKPAKKKATAEQSRPGEKVITLGGYEVTKKLGQGGMGTVFLARQISLDRPVALKVMNKEWAKDPTFLARFIREAYAAAQLTHHHIVQIYDIGEKKGTHYFSMELVKGQTLSDLIKEHGKLDVEEATGYILQAARGLYFAHQQGMIHRDVKPDNLMLNDQGIVKVADLGLVKTPGVDDPEHQGELPSMEDLQSHTSLGDVSNVTRVGLAVGTPAYMAPEQWRSAADVDARADMYALGCTWYALLTGKPPFRGETALEVMTKHIGENPVPPEHVVKRVPPEVSGILLKTIEKDPDDRFATMGELIVELEKLLGLQQAGPFSPTEDQSETLEKSVKQFNEAPAARMRSKLVPGFFVGCAALTVVCCFISLRLAGGILGLGLLTALFSVLVHGFTTRTYLFLKFREYLLGSRWNEWITWGIGALLALALLYVTGLLQFWLAFCALAACLTAGYYVLVLKPLNEQRKEPVAHTQKLLKQLRLRGIPEEGVQQFICKYSGEHWEEMYEQLFGYERMIYARQNWAPIGGDQRNKHAAWRDPVVHWIEAQQRARQEARERAHLQKVERESLEAQGVDKAAAKAQAEQAADAMVQVAAGMKDKDQSAAVNLDETQDSLPGAAQANAQLMMQAAAEPQTLPPGLKRSAEGRGAMHTLSYLFGGQVRFLIGAVLLVLFALWVQANGLVAGGDLSWESFKLKLETAEPLGILPGIIGEIFSGFNPGVAGLLLVISALVKSRRLLIFLLLGAVISVIGHLVGVPAVGPFTASYVSILLGLGIAEFGVVFHRMTKPQVE